MEHLNIKLNDVERFDAVLHDSLPDGGDIEIITKDGAMASGRAGVMITFSVQLPDGTMARAQTVTSMRLFRGLAYAITQAYNDDGFRVGMADPLDNEVIQ